jgi:tetratricopeptide (TPR) repeat protein
MSFHHAKGGNVMENEIFREGVAAAKAGDRVAALKRFQEFVKQNPESEDGWLALGYCLDNPKLKEYCYKKVLSLNPDNETAKSLLTQLNRSQKSDPEVKQPSEQQKKSTVIPNNQLPQKRLSKSSFFGFFLGFFVVGGLLFLLVTSYPPTVIDEFIRAIIPSPRVYEQSSQATETAPAEMILPPTWTPILLTGTTGVQTPTPPSSLSLTQRFINNNEKIGLAFQHVMDENYAEAILLWDQIIEAIPEYAHAYYGRGVSYLRLTDNQRFLGEYRENSGRAYADLTKAIELDPYNGDYYRLRVDAIDKLIGISEFRVDSEPLVHIALEDTLQAYLLGNYNPWETRAVGVALTNAGYCEEALDYFLRLTEERENNGEEPSPTINERIGNAYLCLGEYQKALEYNTLAISLVKEEDPPISMEQKNMKRVLILTALKRYREALEINNDVIEKNPYYRGDRYYIRALVYYKLGKPDLAYEDLNFGSTQTWGQYTIRAYVLGLLALDEGDKENGLYWLQIAEASLSKVYLPHLYAHTLEEIHKLGGTLLHPTPTPSPTSAVTPTPIPVIADHVYFTPTPPAPLFYKPDLANYTGTGIIYMDPGGELILLFRPTGYYDFHQIEGLTVNLSCQHLGKSTLLEFSLFQLDGSVGETINLLKGENVVLNPKKYVDSAGYFHARLTNSSLQPVVIENISIQLVVKNQDGKEETYGYGK